jgi:hypothetical protein
MTHRRVLGAVLVAVLALAGGARAAPGGVSVTVDRPQVATQLGREFTFRSTIANHASTGATGLIAHLNVLSLRDGVYVDPEDWSSQRTRYLGPIPAGGSRTITWRVKAVNAGSFAVYVAALPGSGPPRPPATGPAIHVAVAGRRTLNAGGILPLAVAVPALLGLVTVVVRLRRRA